MENLRGGDAIEQSLLHRRDGASLQLRANVALSLRADFLPRYMHDSARCVEASAISDEILCFGAIQSDRRRNIRVLVFKVRSRHTVGSGLVLDEAGNHEVEAMRRNLLQPTIIFLIA